MDRRSLEGKSLPKARGSEGRTVGSVRDARRYGGRMTGWRCWLLLATASSKGEHDVSVSLDWLEL